MVEVKKSNYWNEVGERGKTDSDLGARLNVLLSDYAKLPENEIFTTKLNDFCNPFVVKVNSEQNAIYSDYKEYSEREIEEKRERFFEHLQNHLILTVKKKAMCSISFSAYKLLKFVEALSSLIDEVMFEVKEDKILVEIMDPSRICLIRLTIKDKSYKFFKAGKLSLNVNDFNKVISCAAGDNADTTLIFGEETLYITLKSKARGGAINRTLTAIELSIEPIPFDNLEKIDYPFSFDLTEDQIEYTLKNLGIYSEITYIGVVEDRILFSESGQIGESEIAWKKEEVSKASLEFGALKTFIENFTGEQRLRQVLESALKNKKAASAYSLTFLNWIKKMASVLNKDDSICFWLCPSHPLKVKLRFPSLGETEMLYFLACRVEEGEPEPEDETP